MTNGAMVPQTGLKGEGVLIPVVGPDASAKAELIASAKRTFANDNGIVFPVNIEVAEKGRPVANGQMSQPDFKSLAAAGGIAISWIGSSGQVGLPAVVFDDLAAGRVVVVNVSRKVVGQLRRQHSRVHVVYLTRSRAARRGVPPGQSEPDSDLPDPPVTIIENTGPLTEVIDGFFGILQSYVPVPSP